MMKIVISQSKFPLKSHICDAIRQIDFPPVKNYLKTRKKPHIVIE